MIFSKLNRSIRSRISGYIEINPQSDRLLGGPKPAQAREIAQATIKAHADQHAANVMPIIREAQRAGATSLRDIAEVLNARGIATARGGKWHASSVRNVLERLN